MTDVEWDRSPRVLPDTSGVEFSILGEGASCAFFVSRDVLEALARQVAFTARDLMALFRTVEDEIVFRALQLFTPGQRIAMGREQLHGGHGPP